MALAGVPDKCPQPEFQFRSGNRPQLVGFRFPEVPGVPPLVDSAARRFKAAVATGDGDAAQMPVDEWHASLTAIAGEFDRGDYHLRRFTEILEVLKARRAVAGGPVFGDPAPARALYCEAVGYLSAVRTAIDIIVFVAARRSGRSINSAEDWSTTAAVCGSWTPGSQSRYDVDDIRALRAHRDWYDTLNLYRNCMLHRGWHEQAFGYFSRGDTAPEADDPQYNVMLVPDKAPLTQRARPEAWTYNDKRWLDVLIEETRSEADVVIEDLLTVWDVPAPAPGTMPEKEQPNVFLTVPVGRPLAGQSPPVIHVFTSKKAGRAFYSYLHKRGYDLSGSQLRATRRMALEGCGRGFLLAYDAETLGGDAELHLMDVKYDEPLRVHVEQFKTGDRMGPVEGTLWFQLPTFQREVLYILDPV